MAFKQEDLEKQQQLEMILKKNDFYRAYTLPEKIIGTSFKIRIVPSLLERVEAEVIKTYGNDLVVLKWSEEDGKEGEIFHYFTTAYNAMFGYQIDLRMNYEEVQNK